MRLTEYSGTINTTGGAGVATGSSTITVSKFGHLEYVYLNFHADAPATTDTTVAYSGTPPGGNILVKSNSATDALFWPRAKAVDNAAAAITDSHTRFPVQGVIDISLAQCDALTGACVVTLGVAH